MAENETPSKTVLLERRDERALVVEGKSVLEERRDILAQAIISELRLALDAQKTLHQKQELAMSALRNAALRHGPMGLRRLASPIATHTDPGYAEVNYFGTCFISTHAEPETLPAERRWDASEDAAHARRCFHELVSQLLLAACHFNNLGRLTREFRRSQRKVNALEYVVIPELEQSIGSIEFVLEETERENMVRALSVKRRSERV